MDEAGLEVVVRRCRRAEEVRTGRDSRDRGDRADRVVGTGRISETDSVARVAVAAVEEVRLASPSDDDGGDGDRERDAEACRHQRTGHHAPVVDLAGHRTADRVDRRVARSAAVGRSHRSRLGVVAVVDDRLRHVDTEADSRRSDVRAARYVLVAIPMVVVVVPDYRAPVSVSSMSPKALDLELLCRSFAWPLARRPCR